MPRKHPPTNVDKILNALSPERAEEFRQWAKYRSLADIQRGLVELYDSLSPRPDFSMPSIPSVSHWYQQQQKRGDGAVSIVAIAREYTGIREDAIALAEYGLALTARAAVLLEAVMPRPEEVAPLEDRERITALAYSAHNLGKELRTGAIALNDAKVLEDRRSLYLNGAYRLAAIMSAQASEGQRAQLEELLRGGLQQLEAEANG